MDAQAALERLSASSRRNLLALSSRPQNFMTISEMADASSRGMTLLCISENGELAQRRWTKWGGEIGQIPGEGFEYAIKPFGLEVRALLIAETQKAA